MTTRPWWLLCAVLTSAAPVHDASAQDLNSALQELTDIEADAEQMVRLELRRARLRSATHVEERLTDGELFFRLQDYLRAAVIFTDIVDNHQSHPACADATFLLADSLFRAGDYFGARTRFRSVLEHSTERTFQPYIQRALGRLIEIAIHIRDFSGVDEYFERLSRLPSSDEETSTSYFKAKYLYNKAVPYEVGRRTGPVTESLSDEGLEKARLAFEQVSERSPYFNQASYFLGVIYALRHQLPQAIQAFERTGRLDTTTEQQSQVAELTRLALGRVYYEAGQSQKAIDSYGSIPRTSSNFDLALYENAWAFIQMGDSTRAEQSLEVLAIAVPESRHIADAKLLRGNLLLREGRFDESTAVFDEVNKQFSPVREELAARLEGHSDVHGYFRKLVHENMTTFDANAFLPKSAQRWAQVGPEMDRAMGTLLDLSTAQRLVLETEDIVHRLGRAIEATNQVNMFSDLRMHRERTITLRNRLAQVRRVAVAAEEQALSSIGSSELTELRKRRRTLEKRIDEIPKSRKDIQGRNAIEDEEYQSLLRQLSKLETELLGLDARIVATERFVSASNGTRSGDSGVQAVMTELEIHKRAVAGYREALRSLDLDVEAGRIRVGVGDQRFVRDAELRKAYGTIVAQERAVAAKLGGGPPAELEALFRRMDRATAHLDAHDAKVDGVVAERIAEMERVVGEEKVNLDGYRSQLTALEGTSEGVIGAIAFASYQQVQKRFYSLVLRSDVGTVDVSWARREEHRMRVENLTKGRNKSLRALDDEFAEVMDEGGAP